MHACRSLANYHLWYIATVELYQLMIRAASKQHRHGGDWDNGMYNTGKLQLIITEQLNKEISTLFHEITQHSGHEQNNRLLKNSFYQQRQYTGSQPAVTRRAGNQGNICRHRRMYVLGFTCGRFRFIRFGQGLRGTESPSEWESSGLHNRKATWSPAVPKRNQVLPWHLL